MNKSSSAMIEIMFLPGTDIKDAVKESKEMALKLDVAYVKFNFNTIQLSISGEANIDEAVQLFHEALESPDNKFVIR